LITDYRNIENKTELWNLDIPVIWAWTNSNETQKYVINVIRAKSADISPDCVDYLNKYEIGYNNTLTYQCSNLNLLLFNVFTQKVDYLYISISSGTSQLLANKIRIENYFIDINLDLQNITDPVYKKIYKNTYDRFNNQTETVVNELKFVIFNDDQDYFVSQMKKKENYMNRRYRLVKKLSQSNEFIAQASSPDVVIVNRSYVKFPETLAHVMAMANAMLFIITFYYSVVINYYYMRYFLKQFLERLNLVNLKIKIKEAFVKNSKIRLILDIKDEFDLNDNELIKYLFSIVTMKHYFINKFAKRFIKDKDAISYCLLYEEFKVFLSLEKLLRHNSY
jgi:hypothetical protein